MNSDHPLHRLAPERYSACMDAAKARALRLRDEAIRQFWSDVGLALRRALAAARRAPSAGGQPCPR